MIYTQVLIYNHLPPTFVEGITLNKLVGQIVIYTFIYIYVAAHRNNSNQCMIGACCT